MFFLPIWALLGPPLSNVAETHLWHSSSTLLHSHYFWRKILARFFHLLKEDAALPLSSTLFRLYIWAPTQSLEWWTGINAATWLNSPCSLKLKNGFLTELCLRAKSSAILPWKLCVSKHNWSSPLARQFVQPHLRRSEVHRKQLRFQRHLTSTGIWK